MNKTWLRIILAICIIIVIIVGIRKLKSTDKGTPNQSQKGSPF